MNASSGGKTKGSITNRLSELRSRSEEEDRAFMNDRMDRRSDAGHESDSETDGATAEGRRLMGSWPSTSQEDEDLDALTLAGAGGAVTPRSMRYLISDPKPEIKLLHRFKPGHGPDDGFWRNFVDKCRLAWGVFFPPTPRARPSGIARWAGNISRFLVAGPSSGNGLMARNGAGAVNPLSAKQVVLSRLQMVLIADRCGVSPEQLLEMKAQTLTALAEYMGKDLQDDVSQLEVQVSALKPNGERITMTIGFADMFGDEQLRDPLQYHYEFEDDDDYFMPEEDDGRVADIAEAPAAGLKAVRVAAKTVAAGQEAGEAATASSS